MNIIKKASALVGRDTKARDESKKVIVVIRLMVISIFIYIVINGMLCSMVFRSGGTLLYAVFGIFFAGIFAMSYFCRTLSVLWTFNIGMILWIFNMVRFFGWNIGVQHFLMVLLVLYFFSSYKQYAAKILYAIALCGLRLLFFVLYNHAAPGWQLPESEENLLQIINTITIFWCLSVVAFIFSNASRELEGKLIEYNNQLQLQANTDALTGLYNRRKALDYIEDMLRSGKTNKGFCLCICDIDFFKKINDDYGHDFGDEVLEELSRILMKEMTGSSLAARWGGEEFLLLFPECNGDTAYEKVYRIRERIKEMRVRKNGIEAGVTMTFGLAEYDFINGLEATIKEADEKLYMGKENGRDTIIF